MTEDRPGTRAKTPVNWQRRKDWEEIQHLAETALKMLEDPSTWGMAGPLITKVEACTQHLKTIEPNTRENAT